MKAEIALETVESVRIVEERIIRYLEMAGYKTSQSEGAVVFKRGSLFGSWTSFSPKKWKAIVKVHLLPVPNTGTKVVFFYNINITGQSVTQSEVDFWNVELAGLQKAVVSGDSVCGDGDVAARTAVKSNWQLIGTGLLLTLLVVGLLVPLFPLTRSVAFSVSRWIVLLVPSLGREGVALLGTVLLIGVFGILAFVSKTAGWLGKFKERYLQNAPRFVIGVLAYIIYAPLFGVLSGCFLGLAAATLGVRSKYAIWYWFIGLTSMVAIPYILSRKRRKQQSEPEI